jgi:hypothetical protein
VTSWKWILVSVAVVLAALTGLGVHFRLDRTVRLATGSVAHMVCTKAFVSGLDPQAVFAETMERPGFRRLRHVMKFEVDRKARAVEASTLGLFRGRASFHDGLGCVEQHGAKEPYLLKNDVETLRVSKTPPLLPEIAGPAVVEPTDPALKAALDLHEDWVDFCAAATLNSDYTAGFYTNRSDHPDARGRVHLGMPSDSFFASGLLGQRVVIMPSQRLVVVRLGDSVDPTGDMRGLARLVKEVIAAVQP